jgi:UDP-GlcNAc:undecaprenyl-phosphate GlcNAc-1-phosphate transferase
VYSFGSLVIDWRIGSLAALSFVLCGLIVFLRGHVPRLSGRVADLAAIQSMHTSLTPRVGGIAVFGALLVSLAYVPSTFRLAYAEFVGATGLLFLIGLMEDLGFPVSPRTRLVAAVVSGLGVIWMLGVWLPRADISGLDSLMTYWQIGVPLTILVTAGISNGFNLIDGVNGLAALTAIVASVALAMIANQSGFSLMVQLSLMLAAAVLGFFLLNYPFGLLFLGDAGAYTLGFVLAWFGIFIVVHSSVVTPWAILLTLFWPVADTMLAIYRRFRRKSATMAPDRLHAHQMVMRALEILFLGRDRRRLANPLSTLVLAPFVIAPPVTGVLFWNQTIMAFVCVVGFGVVFFFSYVFAPWLIRRYRWLR